MNELLNAAPLWLPGAAAMAGLIVASGFFSGSETAIFYLSRDELRVMQMGKPRERMVAELLRDPDRVLTAILFWNLLINLTYFAVSVVTARQLVRGGYSGLAGLISFLALAAIIVFGEIVPKSLSITLRRHIAVLVSYPLALAVRILDPILPTLSAVTRGLRRAFWPNLKTEPYIDTDDIERAVTLSEVGVDIIQHERELLHSVLDLSNITVEEIMRPRGTYTVWRPPIHRESLIGTSVTVDYLLVQEKDGEGIAAAVPLSAMSSIPEEGIEELAEAVLHVPWCASVADTLELLRERLYGLACVVNEYGETIGIVTYEDIVDTILTADASRAKRVLRREPVLEIGDGKYHVDGLTTLRYLSKRLGIDYDPNSDGLLTVTGLLHERLQRFPDVGDRLEWCGYDVRVIDVPRRGRLRVMVSPAEPSLEAPLENG